MQSTVILLQFKNKFYIQYLCSRWACMSDVGEMMRAKYNQSSSMAFHDMAYNRIVYM